MSSAMVVQHRGPLILPPIVPRMSEERERKPEPDGRANPDLRRQAQAALRDLHLVEVRVKRIVDLYEERLRNEPPRQ
jgi:hypothetical protein